MFFIPLLLLVQSTSSLPQEFIAPVYELGSYIPPLPTGDVPPGIPSKQPPIDLGNRVGEGDEKPVVPPSFVLGSNVPISSIPGWTPSQIIPPGKPWPSAEVEKTTKSPPVTGFIWPSVGGVETDRTTTPSLGDRFGVTGQTTNKVTILDYKPTRPSYHPNPGNNIQQIIPPGEPWPAKPIQTTKEPSSVKPATSPSFSLEYKPNRPSYHPSPGNNIQQIIPSGEPWPSFAISDRIQDTYSTYPTYDVYANYYQIYVPENQRPAIVLDYKPSRPFYAGQPKE